MEFGALLLLPCCHPGPARAAPRSLQLLLKSLKGISARKPYLQHAVQEPLSCLEDMWPLICTSETGFPVTQR